MEKKYSIYRGLYLYIYFLLKIKKKLRSDSYDEFVGNIVSILSCKVKIVLISTMYTRILNSHCMVILTYQFHFMKKVLFSIFLVSFLGGMSAAWWTNYVMKTSSVDHGEIRWWWYTSYSTQLASAITVWNTLKKIKIAPDNALTYEDVTFSDVSVNGVGWYGIWIDSYVGSDPIQINTALLKNKTSNQKQNIITHELGHALWLDHHDVYDNVMFYDITSKISLWKQDIADYQYLYGY